MGPFEQLVEGAIEHPKGGVIDWTVGSICVFKGAWEADWMPRIYKVTGGRSEGFHNVQALNSMSGKVEYLYPNQLRQATKADLAAAKKSAEEMFEKATGKEWRWKRQLQTHLTNLKSWENEL